jgi:hypothetical protein
MKTKTIFLAPILLLCAILFVQVESVSAQNITKRGLIGIWKLSDAQGNLLKTGDFAEHKVITPTQFMVVAVNDIKNTIVIIYSGKYSLDRIDYTETIEKATPGLEKDVNTVNQFKIETINKDFIHIVGQNNKYDQYWKRVPSLSISPLF